MQLEVVSVVPITSSISGFNSILVQLEGGEVASVELVLASFNSILVQLEVSGPAPLRARRAVSIPYWCN